MSTYYLRMMFSGPDTPSLRGRVRSLINYMLKGYELTRPAYTELSRIISNIIVYNRDQADIETIGLILARLKYVPFGHEWRARERGAERVEKVSQLLRGINRQLGDSPRYLDFGCGDGSITQAMAKTIGAVPMGTDVIPTPPHIIAVNPLLAQPSNSIDICTAFVSLHHVVDIHAALREIARILHPEGVFVIREHDYNGTSEMRAYLEFIHLFGALKCGEAFDVDELPPVYRSARQWDELLAQYGFVKLLQQNYDVGNPQGLYFAVFANNGKQ